MGCEKGFGSCGLAGYRGRELGFGGSFAFIEERNWDGHEGLGLLVVLVGVAVSDSAAVSGSLFRALLKREAFLGVEF